jgi:hypothetical protein
VQEISCTEEYDVLKTVKNNVNDSTLSYVSDRASGSDMRKAVTMRPNENLTSRSNDNLVQDSGNNYNYNSGVWSISSISVLSDAVRLSSLCIRNFLPVA